MLVQAAEVTAAAVVAELDIGVCIGCMAKWRQVNLGIKQTETPFFFTNHAICPSPLPLPQPLLHPTGTRASLEAYDGDIAFNAPLSHLLDLSQPSLGGRQIEIVREREREAVVESSHLEGLRGEGAGWETPNFSSCQVSIRSERVRLSMEVRHSPIIVPIISPRARDDDLQRAA
uniref:Uncharacterized protein n=1 Tax=Nelumbo nucifera TaxID=4432 RepID=A0A822ZJT7_NELNU|nr:TPA_asm: hypothetical protein HUJ06_003030 [Nelumbo nucifera]